MIPALDPGAESDLSPLLNVKPVDSAHLYPCILPPANYHVHVGFGLMNDVGFCHCGGIDRHTPVVDIKSQ
jgi:hypothetical protein